MFLMTGDIRCPMCGQDRSILQFWKQIGDMYFHICSDCYKNPMTDETTLLRMGWITGRSFGIANAKEKLEELDG